MRAHACMCIPVETVGIQTLTKAQSEYGNECTRVIDVKMLASRSKKSLKHLRFAAGKCSTLQHFKGLFVVCSSL